MRTLTLILASILVTLSLPLMAQDTGSEPCPLDVERVIAAVGDACAGTDRNQICYGHFDLSAEPAAENIRLHFADSGDRVDVHNIRTIRSTPLHEDAWGVALMKLQANVPGTLPGQNVVFLLFGDVLLEDRSGQPGTRTDGSGGMQAVYLQTGIGDAGCRDAPESGLMIQTPAGVAAINLHVNGVDIAFGSTIYLQAKPGDALIIRLLEGHARVTAFGVTRRLPAGALIRIPLDDDGNAIEAPEPPEPYLEEVVWPLRLPARLLDRLIEIAPPWHEEVHYFDGTVYLTADGCDLSELYAGRIGLFLGNGGYATCDAAHAELGTTIATFSGTGPDPVAVYQEGFCHVHADGLYGIHSVAEVILEPGTYTYSATWLHGTRECTFTVGQPEAAAENGSK